MLAYTKEERESVENYFLWQSPEATISFVQKVYSETIAGHRHDVWDIHSSDGRWWIITNPTNLYSQTQFPNMDYAVTFHLGLCVRIPRTNDEDELIESCFSPFSLVLNELHTLPDSLGQAKSLSDYQGIGVKCRELLLSFVGAAQDAINWPVDTPPQRANFRAWIDIIFDTVLGGQAQQERRRLFKSLFNEAWTFTNWLTHTKSATWHDAEAAQTTVDHAIGFGTSVLLRVIRLVPEQCPKCGSPQLAPEESRPEERPGTVWQRPACQDCDWTGLPVRVDHDAQRLTLIRREGGDDTGECIVPDVPLTRLARPQGQRD